MLSGTIRPQSWFLSRLFSNPSSCVQVKRKDQVSIQDSYKHSHCYLVQREESLEEQHTVYDAMLRQLLKSISIHILSMQREESLEEQHTVYNAMVRQLTSQFLEAKNSLEGETRRGENLGEENRRLAAELAAMSRERDELRDVRTGERIQGLYIKHVGGGTQGCCFSALATVFVEHHFPFVHRGRVMTTESDRHRRGPCEQFWESTERL